MYHRTTIIAAGEDRLPEVEVDAHDARTWIGFGHELSLWLDYRQVRALVHQLVAKLPPEGETVSEDQLRIS